MGGKSGIGKLDNVKIVGALGDLGIKKTISQGRLGSIKVTFNIEGQNHTFSLKKLAKLVDSVSNKMTTKIAELSLAKDEIAKLSTHKKTLLEKVKCFTGKIKSKTDEIYSPLLNRNLSNTDRQNVDLPVNTSSREEKSRKMIEQLICSGGEEIHLGTIDHSIFEYIPGLKFIDDTTLTDLQKFRLNELQEMAQCAVTLQNDQFKKGVINEIIAYRLAMKKEGVSNKIPGEIYLNPRAKEQFEKNGQLKDADMDILDHTLQKGILYDGNGRLFGHAPYHADIKAAQPRLALIEFMKKHGGDYQVITSWKTDQMQSSWSSLSQTIKYQLTKYRKTGRSKYYWQSGKLKAFIHHRRATSTLNKSFQCKVNHKQIDQTIKMQMAFQMEFFSVASMPGVNKETGTIRIYRTENKKVLSANDIINPGTAPCTMKRGPAESGSLFAPISANTTNLKSKEVDQGTAVTFQEVPLHRIFDTFMMGDLKDCEMEAVFMTDNLPFQYVGDIGTQEVTDHVKQGLNR